MNRNLEFLQGSRVPSTGPSGEENTSGMGRNAVIPPEIRGWSWGAFLLAPVWGIGNGVYFALFTLLLPIAIVIMLVLGFKGREWAWRNKYWSSVEHFNRVQRRWTIAGIILWALSFPLVLIYSINVSFSGPKELALEAIRQNSMAVAVLGEPLQAGRFVNGSMKTAIGSGDGCAILSFSVSGPKYLGSAEVLAIRRNSNWLILNQDLIINNMKIAIIRREDLDEYVKYVQPCL